MYFKFAFFGNFELNILKFQNLGVLLYDNITNEILEENNSLTKEGKKLKLVAFRKCRNAQLIHYLEIKSSPNIGEKDY